MANYWTDQMADEIGGSPIINDSKTPSGRVHIGSLRGVILHDAIFRSLKGAGEFLYGFDDMDPLDSLPVYLPKEFEKYMGLPFCKIPAPEGKPGNYARYFAGDFIDVFEKLGAHPKLYWMSELYSSGRMNPLIRTVLENATKIRHIYAEVAGSEKGAGWLPFQPICEKCGKIGTTMAFEFENEHVRYECVPDMVDWAKGCGHEGVISPYDGNGKLPWKVEWAAKWSALGVTCEMAGKDHYTKGGSRMVAEAIAAQVFGRKAPQGFGYEFFLIKGKKMSSSKGIGASAAEVADIVPPELLRFILVKTRPNAQIEFDPEGMSLPRLYEEYDKYERVYFGVEEASGADAENVKRIYELSQIAGPAGGFEKQVPFTHIVMLVQIARDASEVLQMLNKTGHPTGEKTRERMKYAREWVNGPYAPEEYRIRVAPALPKEAETLGAGQKGALSSIAELVATGREDAIDMGDISKKAGLAPKDIFEASYIAILGKGRGPRLVPLLAALAGRDREFLVSRLRLEK